MPKTPSPQTNIVAADTPRTLKPPVYRSFRLQKRIKTEKSGLPSGYRLFVDASAVLIRNYKLFLGIVVVYGLLSVLLVRGLDGGTNLGELKTALSGAGDAGQLLTSTALFAYLVGASGNTSSDVANVFQLFLGLITSLAIIWSLRQVYAGKKVRIRDGFYFGMYPLVPFILVLSVAVLQLVPFLVGAFLFGVVQANAVAITTGELVLWAFAFFLLTLVSLYLLVSSLIALYIVCLPDMQPMAALRSARNLVRQHRWTILRKIVFLPFMLLVLAALVMIPLIWFAAPVAVWVFFVLSMLGLPIMHSYMYRLYRELL